MTWGFPTAQREVCAKAVADKAAVRGMLHAKVSFAQLCSVGERQGKALPQFGTVVTRSQNGGVRGEFLSVCGKTPRKQDRGSCDLGFFQITELFLEFTFTPLPGVVHRNELTSDCSL